MLELRDRVLEVSRKIYQLESFLNEHIDVSLNCNQFFDSHSVQQHVPELVDHCQRTTELSQQKGTVKTDSKCPFYISRTPSHSSPRQPEASISRSPELATLLSGITGHRVSSRCDDSDITTPQEVAFHLNGKNGVNPASSEGGRGIGCQSPSTPVPIAANPGLRSPPKAGRQVPPKWWCERNIMKLVMRTDVRNEEHLVSASTFDTDGKTIGHSEEPPDTLVNTNDHQLPRESDHSIPIHESDEVPEMDEACDSNDTVIGDSGGSSPLDVLLQCFHGDVTGLQKHSALLEYQVLPALRILRYWYRDMTERAFNLLHASQEIKRELLLMSESWRDLRTILAEVRT